MRFLLSILIICFVITGCKKKYASDESILHGTWVKGANFGDTLWFITRNGQHIMRQAMSFNSGIPVYVEREYTYEDGRLSVRFNAQFIQDYTPITSFTWTNIGSEFNIQGIELYPFMSSTATVFTFHKIN
jgi:hypothetical protein